MHATKTRDPHSPELLLLIHAPATLAAWLKGLSLVTARPVAHPPGKFPRPRHSPVWVGWESLRRRRTHLSMPLSDSCARLRCLLVKAA
jgi:hypothetical protein